MKDSYQYLPMKLKHHLITTKDTPADGHTRVVYGVLVNPHQTPGSAHSGMFVTLVFGAG